MNQMTLEPLWPKEGTVRYLVLSALGDAYPGGVCRREFAHRFDVYEVSNRIGELKAMGWRIGTKPCKRHDHKAQIVDYYLERD